MQQKPTEGEDDREQPETVPNFLTARELQVRPPRKPDAGKPPESRDDDKEQAKPR